MWSGFFRVGSALSLRRRSCGRKYTCASGRAHGEKSTSYTWKCWQGPHRCTLNLDSRLCVSSKAAATNRNMGCAILGSHHNQLYLLLILPCDAFLQVDPCCPAPNACPHIPTLRWKSASLLYPCWRHVLEDLFQTVPSEPPGGSELRSARRDMMKLGMITFEIHCSKKCKS